MNSNNSFVFNTRPINLFSCDGTIIEMPYTLDDIQGTSSVFRVEKLMAVVVL